MDLNWLSQYAGWIFIGVLILIDLVLYRTTKHCIAQVLENEERRIFMLIPLPLFLHWVIFFVSVLFTWGFILLINNLFGV